MNWKVLWAKLKALEGKVDSLELITLEKVETLPEVGERNVIYLVPKSDPETGNYSDEYIWDSDEETYEQIGDTMVSPLPEVTEADNGKVLGVANGEWGKVEDNILVIPCEVSVKSGKYYIYSSVATKQTIYDIVNNNSKNILVVLKVKISYSYSLLYDKTLVIALLYNGTKDSSIAYAEFGAIVGKKKYQMNMVYQGLSDHYLGEFKMYDIVDPNIAPAYSASSTYALGDLCIYNDILYECTTAITVAEAWTAAHWTAKKVADELAVKANISDIPTNYTKDTATAPIYDNTATYAVGDICMYDKELYKCNTAIGTAEEWNSAHWTKTDVISEMPVPVPAVTDYAKDSSIAPLYDATATYDIGDICMYQKELYVCNTDISVAEEWDSTHWTKTNIIESIPKELPEVTSADAGKMAIVDSNGEWSAQLGPFQQTVTGTLEAGETSITLSHANITTDSVLDIYTDTYGVNPTAVTVAAGSVTLTFEAQASDLGVKVRFFTDVPAPPMNGNVTIFMSTAVTAEPTT